MFGDNFEITQDSQGRFRLWSNQEDRHLAVQAKSAVEAYRQGLEELAHVVSLQRDALATQDSEMTQRNREMKNQGTFKIIFLVLWAITLVYLVANSTCLGSGLSV